jgi:Leucine-rich repeat (LRR) protein
MYLNVIVSLTANRFHAFPEDVCKLKSLRTLDISDNKIVRLSKPFCKVRTLETLILDSEDMLYPPSGKYLSRQD